MPWKDVTSYSREDRRLAAEPREWMTELGTLRLTVHQHFCDPTKWFVSCDPFFNIREIGVVGDAVHGIQRRALDMLSAKLDEARNAIDNLES